MTVHGDHRLTFQRVIETEKQRADNDIAARDGKKPRQLRRKKRMIKRLGKAEFERRGEANRALLNKHKIGGRYYRRVRFVEVPGDSHRKPAPITLPTITLPDITDD